MATSSKQDAVDRFHTSFGASTASLQQDIDSLNASSLNASDRTATSKDIHSGMARLSAALTDAASYLPSYSQRVYQATLKDLQDRLEAVQASHGSKPKFSFKSKKTNPPKPLSREIIDFGMPSAPVSTPITAWEDTNFYTTTSRTHELVMLPPADGARKTCVAQNIRRCVLNFGSAQRMAPSSLTLTHVDHSLIIAFDIQGPVHMTMLRDSVLVLGCRQFRMHDSNNVHVYLNCTSRPIIEDCTNIKFTWLPDIAQTDAKLTTESSINLYDQVDDFKWLRGEHSPNWRVLEEREMIPDLTWNNIMKDLESDRESMDVDSILLKAGLEPPATL